MSLMRLHAVLLFGAAVLGAAVPQAQAQRGGRATLNPKGYKSPSGEYELRVDPSTMYGQGEGGYRMTRKGQEVWAKKLPFTLWDAEVLDDGTVAGYAYSLGRENIPLKKLGPNDPFDSVEGKLHLVILDPQGGSRMNEVFPRRGMNSCMTSIDRNVAGFILDPGNDRFIVRTWENGSRLSLDETWRTYRVSTGKLLDEFGFAHPRTNGQESWFLLAARPVAGTPLILVNWSYTKWGQDGNGRQDSGGSFSLITPDAKPIWELDRPRDYPEYSDFSSRLDKDKDAKEIERLTILERRIRQEGAILRTDRPRHFDVWFVSDNERVTFEVARDGESGWRVSEAGRQEYAAGKASPPQDQTDKLDSLKLQHLGTIKLRIDDAPLPEIRNIAYFDVDDRGRIGFLRREGERAQRFVLIDANGVVQWQTGLNEVFGDQYYLTTATWIEKDRWLLVGASLREVPGAKLKESTTRAFWLDVDTHKSTPIDPFTAQHARHVAATHDGGFVVILSPPPGPGGLEAEPVVAFGRDGKERWRFISDPQEQIVFGTSAVAVTTDGKVVVAREYGSALTVLTLDGTFVRTMECKEAFDKEAEAKWLTPDLDGGLIIPSGYKAGAIQRIALDDRVRSHLTIKQPDGRLIDLAGFPDEIGVRVDKSGILWACDKHALFRFNSDGVVDRVLGEAPDKPVLRWIEAGAIDQRGNVYLVEKRSAITHVFDPNGGPVRLLRPNPDDFERSWDAGSIEIKSDGSAVVGLVLFSPAGERVGRIPWPEGPERGSFRFPAHGDHYWIISDEELYLIGSDNRVAKTIKRRPDGSWLDRIGGSAVSPDGALVVGTGPSGVSAYWEREHRTLNFYTPAGEPLKTVEVPNIGENRPMWGQLAYNGRYVLLGPWEYTERRYLLLDSAADPPKWYDVGRLEPDKDNWRYYFVKDGHELWMLAQDARQVERFALPDQPTSAPTSLAETRPFTIADLTASYYFGDGEGVNCYLTLGADKRFSFKWLGCLGTYDENAGSWDIASGLVVLKPEKPNKREGFQGTATRMYPVRWGERLYLVSDDEMIDFCRSTSLDYVFGKDGFHGGRSGFYYMRQGDEKKEFADFPVVPMPYERYLKEPFAGAVTTVDRDGSIVIDRGQADGLVAGTKLRMSGGDEFGYEVATLTEHTATCVARSPKARAGLVKVGAKVGPFMGD